MFVYFVSLMIVPCSLALKCNSVGVKWPCLKRFFKPRCVQFGTKSSLSSVGTLVRVRRREFSQEKQQPRNDFQTN